MSTFNVIILLAATHAIAFTIGALVFRNNVDSINKLIANGKAFVDATGKIIKK